ncbi:hypothetical protein GCM10027038_22160 [Arthrobacter bambusae]
MAIPNVEIPDSKISTANRFFYSVVSNKDFMDWVEDYQSRLEGQIEEAAANLRVEPRIPEDADEEQRASIRREEALKIVAMSIDRTEVYKDLADALLRFGDTTVIYSAITPGSIESPRPSPYLRSTAVAVEIAVVVLIAAVLVLVLLAGKGDNPTGAMRINRSEVATVAAFLTETLQAKASEVKASGILLSEDILRRKTIN